MSYIIGAVCCALLVYADQFTKHLIVERLAPEGRMDLIPGFIELRYHVNEGAAFGILQGLRWPLLAFTVLFSAVAVYMYIKLPKNRVANVMRGAMTVILAGALGNAIDRARQGFVVDFLNFQFMNFAVFNVADICVVCGTILFAVVVLFFYKEKKEAAEESEGPGV